MHYATLALSDKADGETGVMVTAPGEDNAYGISSHAIVVPFGCIFTP